MLVLLAAGPVSVIACSDSGNTNDCSDGKDNDGDGKIDDADPGCVTDQRESADEGKAKCGNGVDDDGDSKVDFPDDPQCASKDDDTEDGATPAKCQDNRDNDGDGKLDFPDDPGCSAPNADDEMDDCPNGPLCPQCSNGKDDDGNGKSDYPNDSSGCTGASDNDEFTRNLAACGPMVNITPFPAANEVTGILQDGAASRLTSMACGGQGPEVVYELRITEPRVLTITTDFPETTANTVLYLRGTDCASDASEATCNNDISPSKVASTITASVTPGVYYLVIDNDDRVLGGAFKLKLESKGGEGGTCATAADCDGSLVCRIPLGETRMQCAKPVCSDGRDDDADGKTDYPLDPGCATPTDDTETDTCPGAGCPKCSDGLDNDGDNLTDYPADPECAAASQDGEAPCPSETDPLINVVGVTTTSTVSATTSNSLAPSCGTNGQERVFLVNLPALKSLKIDAAGSGITSPSLSVRNAICGAPDIACNASFTPVLTLTNTSPGLYAIVADTESTTTTGSLKINIAGVIAADGSCEGSMFSSGALKCDDGYACKGTSGSRTCKIAACNDTMDNDADGKIDFPGEPGCSTKSDDDETDTCPGAGCPACADGMDNDGDGTTDYPLDLTCTSASGTDESCRSSEGILLPTTNVLTGTTVGRTDDYHPTCSSTASNTGDLTYQLDLPALNTFNLAFTRGDTGYDEVIALLPSTCTTPEVRCTDFPPMALTNVAAGRYFLVVDGYGAGDEGAFTATITGTIAPGGSCESPLATSGGLTCSAGYACSGTMGARTCNLTACNDNTDADGDGKVGFPTDPGCTSTSDNDETDNCPSGPGCPACANALDDDADGATDYPLDAGCASASGTSEVTCPAETDPVIVINGPAFTGTTVGKAHNLTPSCGTSGTSPEVTYELNLTVPVLLLTVDTENSTLDTVMSVRNASCGSPDIDCDDDSGVSSGSSFLELVDVLPGGYTITVDGYSSTSASGAYNLNVKGEVAAGTACTGPLFVQNVLTCTSGTTCTAGTCQ